MVGDASHPRHAATAAARRGALPRRPAGLRRVRAGARPGAAPAGAAPAAARLPAPRRPARAAGAAHAARAHRPAATHQ